MHDRRTQGVDRSLLRGQRLRMLIISRHMHAVRGSETHRGFAHVSRTGERTTAATQNSTATISRQFVTQEVIRALLGTYCPKQEDAAPSLLCFFGPLPMCVRVSLRPTRSLQSYVKSCGNVETVVNLSYERRTPIQNVASRLFYTGPHRSHAI